MTVKQHEPARLCPACSAADPIVSNELLWPRDWRCPTCGHMLVVEAQLPCLAPALDGGDAGFDPRAFARLAEVEGRHFWFQARNELVEWLLRRHAADARRILEIGCGTGFVLHALRAACPGASIAGSDMHSAGLALARARHGAAVELVQADARQLFLRDALDVVCALDVLEHIEDDDAVLAAVRLTLRDGGLLIAAVPQHPWLWSGSDDLARHVRRYRVGEVEGKARAAGFQVRFSDSFVSLLLPAMALSRIVGRIRSRRAKRNDAAAVPSDPMTREFAVGTSLNLAMRAVLRLEHGLRRAGMRFPLGGSRVIVAQKQA